MSPVWKQPRQHLPLGPAVALAVVALVAAACGGSTTASDPGTPAAVQPCPVHALDTVTSPVELVVWHTQQAKSLTTLQQLVDTYNAGQNKVKVRLDAQGTSYQELMRKFQGAAASKQLPGLVMFDDTATQTMADSGVVLPAQACVDADHYDTSDFLQVARNYYTIKDVLWPVSANMGNVLLYYNKGAFRRAGLDPEVAPRTLAELRDVAVKLKASAPDVAPLVQEMSSWKTEFWMTGAHAGLVNNDNGRGGNTTDKATLADNASLLSLWTWFAQMKKDGLMQPVPATEGQINQYLAMASQKSYLLVESSSAATSVESFLRGDPTGVAGIDASADPSSLDIGASVFPGLDAAAGNKTQMGGAAWYLTNTGSPEVQAAAWDFAKFLNAPDAQAQMLIGGSYLPYRNSVAARPDVQAFFDGSLSGHWLKLAYDQVKTIDPSFPGPLIGPYDEFRKAVSQAQDDMMFNDKDPKAALDAAQAAADAAITQYNDENF